MTIACSDDIKYREVIPRSNRETVECNNCGWQGPRSLTDSDVYCPMCGDECYELAEIYGEDNLPLDTVFAESTATEKDENAELT